MDNRKHSHVLFIVVFPAASMDCSAIWQNNLLPCIAGDFYIHECIFHAVSIT